MSTEAGRTASPAHALRERTRGQLSMLFAQFLVGLAIARIGLPADTSGFARTVSIVLLGLHLVIAAGLLVGAILSIVIVTRAASFGVGLVWVSAAVVVVTVVSGVVTLVTKNDWWSYLMGAGATLSLPVYGILYLRSTR